MAHQFKVGDHVSWNYAAEHISGKIIKIHTQDFQFMGQTHRASVDEPRYEVKSDKTGKEAAHKGSALRLV